MSKPMPEIPKGLDPELVEMISGGTFNMCSPEEYDRIISGLRSNYDQLVDFTSYVIGRMAGEP